MLYVLQIRVKNSVTTHWLEQWSDDHVSKLQLDDLFLKTMIEIIQNEEDNTDPVYRTNSKIRQLWNLKDTLVVRYSILYRQWFRKPANNHKLLLIIPKSIIKDLMYELHINA